MPGVPAELIDRCKLINVDCWLNSFSTSPWPHVFSRMAQITREAGVQVDELREFTACERSLRSAPAEEREMLSGMGITQNRAIRPSIPFGMSENVDVGEPNIYVPYFSEFGKTVITVCENLYTPEGQPATSRDMCLELDRRIFGDLEVTPGSL